jgi:hypothetical protein
MLLVIDADGNLYLSHDAGDNWEPVIGVTLDSNGRFSIAFSPTFARRRGRHDRQFGRSRPLSLVLTAANPGNGRLV